MSPVEVVLVVFVLAFGGGFIYVLYAAERDRRKHGFYNGRRR